MKLVEAQEGRRVLDRLVGYEMSPVLWKKMMPRLSAGRVQSVATRLVVERERARMAFRAAEYWDLEGTFTGGGRQASTFPATLVELDGSKVASGRDFDPATGQVAADAAGDPSSTCSRPRPRRSSSDCATCSTGWPRSSRRRSPSDRRRRSRPRRSSKRRAGSCASRPGAPCASPRACTSAGTSRTSAPTRRTCPTRRSTARASRSATCTATTYLPDAPRTYQGKVKNAQEAHEAIRPAGEHMRSPDEVRGELARTNVVSINWCGCARSHAR